MINAHVAKNQARLFGVVVISSIIAVAASCGPSTDTGQTLPPFFSPAGGMFSEDQFVTINCLTAGAEIRYTTDGSEPTAESPAYGGPIPVAGNEASVTVRAMAVAEGMTPSAVVEAHFSIDYDRAPAPFFIPSGGSVAPGQRISILCVNGEAAIRYTLDGSDPTAESALYPGSFMAPEYDAELAIKAVAFVPGREPSPVSSATFYVSEAAPTAVCTDGPSSPMISGFEGSTPSPDGAVYAAGYVFGQGEFTFLSNIDAIYFGAYNEGNALLAKYDENGIVEWLRGPFAGTDESWFHAVATDAAGNVYAVGYIGGNGVFEFDAAGSVTAVGTDDIRNCLIVKYAPSGEALWARSVTAGTARSEFYGVACDAEGAAYAVGGSFGSSSIAFGPAGTHVVNDAFPESNAFIVKYGQLGDVAWARGVSSGAGSLFESVEAAADGSICASGKINIPTSFDPAGAILASGSAENGGGSDAVIVKYDASGTAIWARSAVSGTGQSHFLSIDSDAAGNVYAAGYLMGEGDCGFNASGTVSVTGPSPYSNILLVKYGPSGDALFAKTFEEWSAPGESAINSVRVDGEGSVYVAGYVETTGLWALSGRGNRFVSFSGCAGRNAFVAKFGSAGNAICAITPKEGTLVSSFRSISILPQKGLCCMGNVSGPAGNLYFGPDGTVGISHAGADVALFVRYW
jgi:hypothetical protein